MGSSTIYTTVPNIFLEKSLCKLWNCHIYIWYCHDETLQWRKLIEKKKRSLKKNSQLYGGKKTRIAKMILNRKRTSGSITIPDLKLYYRAVVVKTPWYWNINRQIDQKNSIENPGIDPHTYRNLVFDKEVKTIQWKMESIANKWCWSNSMSACRRMWIDLYLSPCTKLRSKWIKDPFDPNITVDTLNLVEQKVGNNLELIWYTKQLPEKNTNGSGSRAKN